MAKLGAYYGLCPLIDHRSLLGISRDAEVGVVIVTLGKNIAIKFKLSDQKQLYSWRTKDKFSSPIVYDEQLKYVAAFNDSFVRTWSGNEEFLDKLKKLKFDQQIHTIFICKERSFIIFKNGAIKPLQEAIENRRDLTLHKVLDLESEYIMDILYTSFNNNIYVGLIISSNQHCYLCWTKFNELNEQDKFYKIKLQRDMSELRGYVLHVDSISVHFLSLWSDGRVYSAELKEDAPHFGELFTVIESISCKELVSMISLDQNYIAMYGCNSNEEGALLVIYSVQFKVVQARQSFKLFTNGAKIWCIEDKLLFPVGQNLAVVPFYLDMEQLAALVGSHKVIESTIDPDVSVVHKVQFVSWRDNSDEHFLPDEVKLKIHDYTAQGLSKNMIFETMLADIVETKNMVELREAIDYFSDIPENCLCKVLKFILNVDSNLIKNMTANESPKNLHVKEQTELLDMLLSKPFNESLLLSHLRPILTLDEVLILLQYVHFLLSEEGHPLPSHTHLESEAKLIEWVCILLDANYQKLLLTKDDKIKDMLLSLMAIIKEGLDCSDDYRIVGSLISEIKSGKPLSKKVHMAGMDYSIEEFPLY